LTLATRQRQAGLTDLRVVAEGEARDELVRAGHLGHPQHPRHVGLVLAEGDVAGNRVGKHVLVLQDKADLAAQAGHALGQRVLARAAAPDDGHRRSSPSLRKTTKKTPVTQ